MSDTAKLIQLYTDDTKTEKAYPLVHRGGVLDENGENVIDKVDNRIDVIENNLIELTSTTQINEEKIIDKSEYIKRNVYVSPTFLNTDVIMNDSEYATSVYVKCEKNMNYIINKVADLRFRVCTIHNENCDEDVKYQYTYNKKVNENDHMIQIRTDLLDTYLVIYYHNSRICTLSEEEIFNSIEIYEYNYSINAIDSTVREKLDKLIKLLTDKNIINSNDI